MPKKLSKFLLVLFAFSMGYWSSPFVVEAARVGVQSVSGYFTTAANGTDVYYTGGAVGIGDGAPNTVGLSIKGSATTTTANIMEVASTTGLRLFSIGQGGNTTIGTSTTQTSGLQPDLTVNGPAMSLWRHRECNAALIATIVSTDTSNICDGFFVDNTGASWISRADNSGIVVSGGVHMQPGNQTGVGFSAVNDSIYIMQADAGRPDQNNLIMDTILRPVIMSQASSSVYRIGFSNRSLGLTTQPTIGCMFVASTTPATGNWQALCSTALATMTQVDTGVASSTSITATGLYRRFRIETSNGKALFYIGSGSSGLSLVATITTNVPSTSGMSALVGLTKESAGQSPELEVQKLDVWDQPYF